MNSLKAFIAGLAFPSTLIPLLMSMAYYLGKQELLTLPFLHVIPLLWGFWNMLYFEFFNQFLPENRTLRLLLTGAMLGLLIASIGVFWLHIPQILGLPVTYHYLPLIIGPILYAILWLYIVDPLNNLLNVKE